MSGLNKRIIIALLVLAVGTLFTGCGFRSVVNWNGNYLDRADAKQFTIKKAIVDPITSIDIQTRIADVELIEADNFYVEIDYLYWDEEPEYTLEDGVLYFNDDHAFPDSYSINFNLHNKIRVYLPKASTLSDMSIVNSYGDVSITGFVADDLDVTVSYGDLEVQQAAAANSDITLSSGTSKITDFQTGKMNFTNSYGDAKFANINIGDGLLPSEVPYDSFDIKMSSGDVNITGLKTASLEVTDSYGDVTCKDVTSSEFDMDLSSGDLEVKDSDLQEVDISDSYGDVTLQLKGSEQDYSLNLGTSYGKIKVGNKDYEDHIEIDNGQSRSITADLSSGDINVAFE